MKISEIKKDAKIKLTGSYIRCASSSLLYFTIISLITFFQSKITNTVESSIILAIIQAIFLILHWILGYGIIANVLDLQDIKTNSITDFINTTIKNCFKYLKIGLYFLLKILFPVIIFIFAAFYCIGTRIAQINHLNFLCFNQNLLPLSLVILALSGILLIYYLLKYVLVAYIYYDHPDMDEKEIVDTSSKLMQKNKLNFIILLLSFLHWFLLGALILLILNNFIETRYLTPFMVFFYSIIRPYVVVCKYEFYKELEDEKKEA
jgi:uncharacterized membrane protein